MQEIKDPIIRRVVESFIERSDVGIDKYGTMLSRKDLSLLDWIRHAREELQDGVNYLTRIEEGLEKGEWPPI